jgi:streptomycin 3"-adenylyltransferase
LTDIKIPDETVQALKVIENLFGGTVFGVYLYGSAVDGGLRENSDVDVFVVVNQRLTETIRRELTHRLMFVSGKIGNTDSVRSLEVTIVNYEDVVPWKYPPRKEFIYGEWLRSKFEQGHIPEPAYDPDLAILLHQVRNKSVPLFGPDASKILDPVPMADIRRAMKDCIPSLTDWLKGDERNVILTFARIWVTAATGDILPKDEAAKWVIARLPKELADLLNLAGKAYRGEYVDKWEGLDSEVVSLVEYMKKEIESVLK